MSHCTVLKSSNYYRTHEVNMDARHSRAPAPIAQYDTINPYSQSHPSAHPMRYIDDNLQNDGQPDADKGAYLMTSGAVMEKEDDEDAHDSSNCTAFVKELGPQFHDINDLVSHPKSGDPDPLNLDSIVSESDYQAAVDEEFANDDEFPSFYDEIPVSIESVDVITGLYCFGETRNFSMKKMLVRNDMPKDPFQFSSCKEGVAAARALHAYQEDDEKIIRTYSLLEVGFPHFQDGRVLQDVEQGTHRDHNDYTIQDVLTSLACLTRHKGEFYMAVQCNPEDVDWGSIDGGREDIEVEDIVALWNVLCPNRPVPWTEDELEKEHLLGPQEDFGENQLYEFAKFLFWEKQHDLGDLELLVRYYFEKARATIGPYGFGYCLSEEENQWDVNYDTPEYPQEKSPVLIPEDERFFDKLHDTPVDWDWKKAGCIRSWRAKIADVIPDNLFDSPKKCREAYDDLLEYQDDVETSENPHIEIEDWARPRYEGPFLSSAVCEAIFSPVIENYHVSSKARSVHSELMVKIRDGVSLRPISKPASRFKDDSAVYNPGFPSAILGYIVPDMSTSTSQSQTGGLMEYIRSSRHDSAISSIDGSPQKDQAEPFQKVQGAPSAKMLASYMQQKACNALPKSSIQVPPGILAAYPADRIRTSTPNMDLHAAQRELFREMCAKIGVARSTQTNFSNSSGSGPEKWRSTSYITRYMESSWDTEYTDPLYNPMFCLPATFGVQVDPKHTNCYAPLCNPDDVARNPNGWLGPNDDTENRMLVDRYRDFLFGVLENHLGITLL